MPVLKEFCDRNGIDLTSCLGQSYKITDEACFRFEFRRKSIWMAQFLKDQGLTGLVHVTNNSSRVLVNGSAISCPDCASQTECKCKKFADFVNSKGVFDIDLDSIFGIGGESLVYKRKDGKGKERAFKIIPYDDIPQDSQSAVQDSHAKFENRQRTGKEEILELVNFGSGPIEKVKNCSEFDFSNIKHPNLMQYENLIIDIVHGNFCLVVGEFILFINNKLMVKYYT